MCDVSKWIWSIQIQMSEFSRLFYFLKLGSQLRSPTGFYHALNGIELEPLACL